MSTYKLTGYNSSRVLAEFSRLIFATAGQKFEDIRYERDEWPLRKRETPLGQMPVLEYNGTQLPQSITIARFLAKQFQLAGKDNFEQAKVDAVVDTIHDTMIKLGPIRFEENEIKKQELQRKFFIEELPKHLQNYEILSKLYGNHGSFFVGNQLTWADLLFYYLSDIILDLDGNCLNNNPWLKQNRAEVEKQPRIAEYLENRPKSDF